jgi:coenzyme F420-reducing hydrogenase beta subunit
MSKKFKDKLVDYWIKHYVKKGHCTLCGNTGVIDTIGMTTRAGIAVGGKNCCICPNGLALRKAIRREAKKHSKYGYEVSEENNVPGEKKENE